MKKYVRLLLCMAAVVSFLGITKMPAQAAGSMTDSPYVTISRDGTRFMIGNNVPLPYTDLGMNYEKSGNYPGYWYPVGTERVTGIQSTLREPRRGEHYYLYDRTGEIPIGRWTVTWQHGRCIHSLMEERENFCGETGLSTRICGMAYPSGWSAKCADCGETISYALIYATKEMINTINYLNPDYGYMFLCPTDRHLENEYPPTPHTCKSVGWNKYEVDYKSNFPTESGLHGGHMDPSFHMFNNETEYEGETITPNKHLTLNDYFCEGYTFVGWSTTPGGSVAYTDGQEIYNLSEYDYHDEQGRGIITLYAVWKTCESTLQINPNGGSYNGTTDVTSITQKYGTAYTIDMGKLTAPKTATVSFETNGGSAIPPMSSGSTFVEWTQSVPFHGKFWTDLNKYGFKGDDGITDTLTATYRPDSITLPTPSKPGENFGGWYKDPECEKEYVGTGGDEYTPTGDETLYANWAKLTLQSLDNYTANGRKGAADLLWEQKDSADKVYKLYISSNGTNFSQIYSAEDGTQKQSTDTSDFPAGVNRNYTVPYTGVYTITAYGAAGAGYGSNRGGAGGMTSARFFLRKGEVLTVKPGAVTGGGYANGGSGTKYANGGGATGVTSNTKGVLLIAGGGGGATSLNSGGAGGSSASVLATAGGGNGGAGGGGGYRGGSGGVVAYHNHVNSYGSKTGDTSNSALQNNSGGCYQQPTNVSTVCGAYVKRRTGCFCSDCYNNHSGNPWGWVGVGSHSPGGYHQNHHYYYTYSVYCDTCGQSGTQDGVKHYKVGTKYGLSCGHTDDETFQKGCYLIENLSSPAPMYLT